MSQSSSFISSTAWTIGVKENYSEHSVSLHFEDIAAIRHSLKDPTDPHKIKIAGQTENRSSWRIRGDFHR